MRLSPAQCAALTDARDLLLIAHRRLRDAQLEEAATAIRGAGAKVRWCLDRDSASRTNERACVMTGGVEERLSALEREVAELRAGLLEVAVVAGFVHGFVGGLVGADGRAR